MNFLEHTPEIIKGTHVSLFDVYMNLDSFKQGLGISFEQWLNNTLKEIKFVDNVDGIMCYVDADGQYYFNDAAVGYASKHSITEPIIDYVVGMDVALRVLDKDCGSVYRAVNSANAVEKQVQQLNRTDLLKELQVIMFMYEELTDVHNAHVKTITSLQNQLQAQANYIKRLEAKVKSV